MVLDMFGHVWMIFWIYFFWMFWTLLLVGPSPKALEAIPGRSARCGRAEVVDMFDSHIRRL